MAADILHWDSEGSNKNKSCSETTPSILTIARFISILGDTPWILYVYFRIHHFLSYFRLFLYVLRVSLALVLVAAVAIPHLASSLKSWPIRSSTIPKNKNSPGIIYSPRHGKRYQQMVLYWTTLHQLFFTYFLMVESTSLDGQILTVLVLERTFKFPYPTDRGDPALLHASFFSTSSFCSWFKARIMPWQLMNFHQQKREISEEHWDLHEKNNVMGRYKKIQENTKKYKKIQEDTRKHKNILQQQQQQQQQTEHVNSQKKALKLRGTSPLTRTLAFIEFSYRPILPAETKRPLRPRSLPSPCRNCPLSIASSKRPIPDQRRHTETWTCQTFGHLTSYAEGVQRWSKDI